MLIKGTKNTPEIFLSSEDCRFEIKGSSYSEHVNEIYDKIINWVTKEVPKMTCELNCIFNLYVLSSISEKKILFIISELNKLFKEGKNISVTWHISDDEDSSDFAEDLSILFKLPIKTVSKS